MERVVRTTRLLRFEGLNYEHVIPLPTYQWEHLQDIEIMIHSDPTGGDPAEDNCVEEVNLYLNDHNLTAATIACLREKLDEGGKHHKWYIDALNEWIKLEKRLDKY